MANFYGGDGDDVVGGGFTNYYGGDGQDFLAGDQANNEFYGGAGNDVPLGGAVITFAGSGAPDAPFALTSFAASGNDYLEGGTGDDVLYGADGDDSIFGGNGNESRVGKIGRCNGPGNANHVRSGRQECLGDESAEPALRPGDERCFVIEPFHTYILQQAGGGGRHKQAVGPSQFALAGTA